MTEGAKRVCPLVKYEKWGGGEASKEERESGVVSLVESLTTAEQTHASERRTEEGERPFNFQLQAEKDFIEGVLKICPHYCIQNCDLAGGEKKLVAREISDIRALRIGK